MGNSKNKGGRPTRGRSRFTDIFTELTAGATQQEAANKIGVTRQNIGKWLSATTTPDIETLCKIAAAYNVTTDYLLGLTDIKTPKTDIKVICEYTGLSEKSVENLNNMKNEGLNADLLLESDCCKSIVKNLSDIKRLEIGKQAEADDEVLCEFRVSRAAVDLVRNVIAEKENNRRITYRKEHIL